MIGTLHLPMVLPEGIRRAMKGYNLEHGDIISWGTNIRPKKVTTKSFDFFNIQINLRWRPKGWFYCTKLGSITDFSSGIIQVSTFSDGMIYYFIPYGTTVAINGIGHVFYADVVAAYTDAPE